MKLLDVVRSSNCNHIVGLYGYYKATKYFWVVMEYCHGYSVSNLMERLNRPMKESHIRTILSHVARGKSLVQILCCCLIIIRILFSLTLFIC